MTERAFLNQIEAFILYLNDSCYEGINAYEFHYALYETGSSYKRHVDLSASPPLAGHVRVRSGARVGFSFALRQTLQFAGSHLLTSLLSFNVGVELGQLLVLVLLIPALDLLFRYVVAERVGTVILSALVGHTAWHWMTERSRRSANSGSSGGDRCRVSRVGDAVDDSAGDCGRPVLAGVRRAALDRRRQHDAHEAA